MGNIWHDISEERIFPTDFISVIEISKGSNVLVMCSEPLEPLTLVRCYPIGVMKMTDGDAGDEKIIAIPWADPTYEAYTDISELPRHIFDEIRHFLGSGRQEDCGK